MQFVRSPGWARHVSVWAIDELVAVDIGDSRHLADAMCESFDRQCGIPADALTDDDLQKLVAKLELTDEIGEHNIGRFSRMQRSGCLKRLSD